MKVKRHEPNCSFCNTMPANCTKKAWGTESVSRLHISAHSVLDLELDLSLILCFQKYHRKCIKSIWVRSVGHALYPVHIYIVLYNVRSLMTPLDQLHCLFMTILVVITIFLVAMSSGPLMSWLGAVLGVSSLFFLLSLSVLNADS
jgi:hypothetical protein